MRREETHTERFEKILEMLKDELRFVTVAELKKFDDVVKDGFAWFDRFEKENK